MRSGFRLFTAVSLAAFLILAGCGGHSHTSTSSGTVVITLPGGSLAAGQSIQLTAIEQTATNQTVDVTNTATWTSSNTDIATVSATGLLTGSKAGSATIAATAQKVSGSLGVTVGAATIATITISPTSPQIFTGGTQQFSASASYSDGTQKAITSAVNWSATPTSIATINASGLLTAVGQGTFTVTASSGTAKATVSGVVSNATLTALTVTPTSATISSGNSQQFTATGSYSDGSTKDLTTIATWTSSNTAALTINSAGLATASTITSTATSSVVANTGSFSANADVTITPQAKMSAIVVRPTSSSIAPGSAAQNTATAYYSDGTQKDVTSQVAWTAVDTIPFTKKGKSLEGSLESHDSGSGNVTISSSGIGTANQVGAATLTASLNGLSSQSVVLVRQASIVATQINSPELVIPVSANQQFVLQGRFDDGSTQDLSLTGGWQSSNQAVATIDSSGLLKAVGGGTTTISAGFNGVSAAPVTVTILPVSLVAITIVSPHPVVSPGVVEQLSIVGTFSDGTSQDVTSLANWLSTDTSVMTVNSSGYVQTLSSGRAQIIATVFGVENDAVFSSRPAELVSLSVLPADADFALGTTEQFTALGIFSDGNLVDLSSDVLWTSNDPAVMTINGNGLAKSGSTGSTTLTASFLGQSFTTTAIKVTNATLSAFTLSANSARIALGTHAQFTAMGWFSDGTVQDETDDVSWSTADPEIASVDKDGTALGLSPGTTTLTASYGSTKVAATITVTSATLESTRIVPGNTELPVTLQRQFSLIGSFSDGTTQDMTADAIWQSPTPTVVAVLPGGIARGVSAGIGTIGAELGNFSSATQVTVSSATLSSITLTPAAPVIRERGSQQMTATGTFSDGFQQNLEYDAIFAAADTHLLYIRATGLAYATGIGSTQITASAQGHTASTTSFTIQSGTLVSMTLTPANPAVTAGASQQFTATGTYADGTTSDISSQVTWTSSNPAVLNVNPAGLATAHAVNSPTTVTVTAQYGSITQTFNVTVSPSSSGGGTVASLAVTPNSPEIAAGSNVQFTAIATYSDGSTGNVTGLATWSSSNPAVATVDANGLATGVGVGAAVITGSYGGSSHSSKIIVGEQTSPTATLVGISVVPGNESIAAGAFRQFTAQASYSDGTTSDISSSVQWSSSNQAVATVSSSGLASGLSAGKVSITAQSGTVSGSAALTVIGSATTIASITVTPNSASIAPGTTQQYHATATLPDGSTQDVTASASWSSSNASVASINSSGLATATAVGATAIGASLSGAAGNAALTVSPGASPTIASIAITPLTASIAPGATQQYHATATYSDGTTQDVTALATWTSSSAAVATINSSGLATGVGSGSTAIGVSLNGASSNASLTVTSNASPTITALTVTPANATALPGGTLQYQATATFADGSTEDVTATATWSSSSPSVASINSSGLASAVAAGTTAIGASLNGSSAATVLTVSSNAAPTITLLTITPNSANIAPGATQQFHVVATYADGTMQDVTSAAMWTSSSPSVATINATGLATAIAAGTTAIGAALNGASANAVLTVANPTPVVSSLSVTPVSANLAPNATQQYHATATYSDASTQDVTAQATWTSSSPSVATINSNGLAQAVTAGSTAIGASFGGASANASLTVSNGGSGGSPILTSISVTPASATVAAGGNQQFTAVGTYSDGSAQDLTSSATWSSSNPSIAVVSSTGLANAVSAGTVILTAAKGAVSGTASFTVTGSGSGTITGLVITPTSSQIISGLSQNFTATATYADGTTHDVTSSVTWASSNPAVAAVNASGVVTGITPGTATITGTVGSVVSQTTVVIEAATLSSLAISPSGASFAAGVQQQFTATATFSNGTRQDVSSSAVWNSAAPNVATVSPTGLVTGVATGTAQISATFASQTAATPVQVTPSTLVSISVSPSNVSLADGTTQQFTVTGTYSDGTTRDLTSQSAFTSSNANVLTISGSGLATGTGAGTATITITVGGESITTQPVTVTPATLTSITITPQSPVFAKGTTVQFTATGTFSDGTTQNLTNQVIWYSSNPQTATIASSGLASSVAPGTTQISCSFSGTTATSGTVAVTPAVLTGLAITPSSAQIAKGTTQQFAATGTYSDGTTQDVSSSTDWTSSDATVASISASGLATGNNIGTTQISASFSGQTVSTSNFSVTPATLVSISFSPASPSVAAGTSAQITVTGTFSDGSTQNLTSTATYSTSNASVATVSTSGLIAGIAQGTSTVTVTVGGVTNIFTASVTAATLSSISITPANPASLPKGTSEAFTATGTFTDGSTQNLTSTATWVTSNAAVLTINTNGVATGTGTGTATVTASYQGFSSTSGSVQVTPAVVATIAVTPAGNTMTSGATQQYAATATYTDATTQDVTASVTWSSSNPTVATVTTTGLVVAGSPGTTTLSAAYSGMTGTTTLSVTPVLAPTLVSVGVTPSVASIARGNTQQFVATGVYSDGSTQNLAGVATWQSSSPGVATVSASGLATAVNGGNTQIWATANGVMGVAALTVSQATLVSLSVTPTTATLALGTSQQYRAVGTLTDGSTTDLTSSVAWTSSSTSVATINSSGFASTTGVGATVISASGGSISASSAMTVTAASVVSVLVTPSAVALPAGGTQQLLVTALFTDGSTQTVTSSAIYLSSNSGVVTVSGTGLVTATGTGSASLTVSLGSGSTTVPVQITSATLSSLSVTPSPLSLAVGQSKQMTATGTFTDGSTQDLTSSVIWSSSSATVATVSLTGQVISNHPGSSTITATNGTVTGSAALTATSAIVTAIAVSPATATLAAGQTQQYTATATMSDGSQQNVTSSAHWSSSNASQGTISNIAGTNGLLLTIQPGTFTVAATLNSVVGSGSVTVTSAVLTSLTVTPNPVSLPAGTTQALTVTGNYSDGSTANVTSTATWTTSSATTASVATGGLLSAVSPGTATTTAHVGLLAATDAVTVTSAVLNLITLNMPSGSVALGLQPQITATGTYTNGSTQDITSQVLWSSSAPSVATVSSTGKITTLSAGATVIGASVNGVTTQATLTVSAAVLSSIAVQSGQSSFALGLSLPLTAIGTYSDNSTQNITSLVTWSSGSPTVGVVSSAGVATGLTTGAFSARATLGSVTGSLSITVTSAVLQSIVVTPANTTILNLLGSSVQYTATGHFSDGSTQNITTSCHWAITSGLSLGSISQTGSFSPLGLGTGTLSATSGTISGSTTFLVVSVL